MEILTSRRGVLRAVLLVPLFGVCSPASDVSVGGDERDDQEGSAAAGPAAPAAFDHSHAAWNRILSRHVVDDRFDYGRLAKDRAGLDAYLDELHAVTPAQLAGWSREQRFAFWINVYNAHVVKLVVDAWPVKSIRDLGGRLFNKVWDKEFIPMEALHPDGKHEKLSLDDVEHGILRPRFEDARVHVAVNCASIGCPPLRAEAYVAARLEEQLDEQARRFVADGRRNTFEVAERGGRMKVSQIFDWFAGDFERDAGSVRAWIARYAPPEVAAWIAESEPEIGFRSYSWDLNDVER